MDWAKVSTVFSKIVATLIGITIIGLPIIELWQLILLLVVTIAIWTSRGLYYRKNFLLITLCLLCVLMARLLPALNIEEGSNIYFPPMSKQFADYAELPAIVNDNLKTTFLHYYPKDKIQKAGASWQTSAARPSATFAFSAQSIWHPAKETRVVHRINFSKQKPFQSSFINNQTPALGYYNFYGGSGAYLAREMAPFFVKYQLPNNLINRQLCWQGVAFIKHQNAYVKRAHLTQRCLLLSEKNMPLTLIGVSFPQYQPLSMQLKLSTGWKIINFISTLATGLALLFLVLLFRIKIKTFLQNVFPVGVILIFLACLGHSMLHNFTVNHVISGGSDGLLYKGYGHAILYQLIHGDVWGALRGQADIFYFMPGMRYIIALESLFFAQTDLGLLLLGIIFVYCLFRISIISYGARNGAIMSALILLVFGKTIFHFALINNAEIAAYCFFTLALLILFKSYQFNNQFKPSKIALSSLLFGLSIIVRPNFLFGVMFSLCFVAWQAKKEMGYVKTCMCLLPLSIAGLVTLHNAYFGHKFVPLTSSAFNSTNFVTPPSVYLSAVKGWLSGHINRDSVLLFRHYLYDWLNHGLYLIPLIFVIYQSRKTDLSANAKLLLWAILGLQLPIIFWVSSGRYAMLPWIYVFMCQTWLFYVASFLKRINGIYARRLVKS